MFENQKTKIMKSKSNYDLGYKEGYHAALNEVDNPSEFLPADEKLNTDFVTPGNWATDGLAVIVPGTFPEIEICVCTEDDEVPRSQAEANALLIADAPRLLKENKILKEYAEFVSSRTGIKGTVIFSYETWLHYKNKGEL